MAILSKFLKRFKDTLRPNMWNVQELGPYGGLVSALSTIVICFTCYCFLKWLFSDVAFPVRDVTKAHSWKDIKITAKSWYCSVCEELLLNGIGVYCDCCGVCSDSGCIKEANLSLPCKTITSKFVTQAHHWIKGNLPLGAMCDVCLDECGVDVGLTDYQCCWCNRFVHEHCLSHSTDPCDFGPFRNMIVPPWCVQLARRKNSITRRLLLRGVKHPGWKDWSPLIVVANRKSGNSDGGLILSEFRRFLNPVQVLDLADRHPAAALQWCVLMAPERIKVLVAAGDGTVAWLLTTAHKLDLEPEPAVGILPLGTGNDLSRVLGWGKEHSSYVDVQAILDQLQNAKVADIDRWGIDILPYRYIGNLGLRMSTKKLFMYNYLSIGVDAQVALDFHKARSSRFYIFGSRIFNKLLYLCFGTQQVVTADCRNIERRLSLYLDGREVELPELESIVILNIQSWGAGVDLWGGNSEHSSQSYNDGVLEVIGIYSSFHIAQLQMGLSKPHRIGQARSIDIHLKAKAPMQVDGEPWEQQPAELKVCFVNHATVLINR